MRSLKSHLPPFVAQTCNLIDDFVPTVEHGDIFDHEFMGEITEVGGV